MQFVKDPPVIRHTMYPIPVILVSHKQERQDWGTFAIVKIASASVAVGDVSNTTERYLTRFASSGEPRSQRMKRMTWAFLDMMRRKGIHSAGTRELKALEVR